MKKLTAEQKMKLLMGKTNWLTNDLDGESFRKTELFGKSYPDTFKIATDSDVAVVICGTYATEGNDRRWLNLIV